jgi:geranylgeranyl diphosphate synthase type II
MKSTQAEMVDLSACLARNNTLLDRFLSDCLDSIDSGSRLVAAMRYSLMAGGKRLRPNLCLAASAAVGGDPQRALPLAAAIEMIHTYSLIHDDLPAMDDDELRRGQKTCHVAFDEATAILAGDALLTLAFQVLASMPASRPDFGLELIRIVASAAGPRGMVAGQMLDMQSEGRTLTGDEMQNLHALKTGAMIEAALVTGAIAGGGSRAQIEAVRAYGKAVGLAFQVVDDILNVEGDPAVMGKAAGTDRARRKNSYPALLGLEKSKEFAQNLMDSAVAALAGFGAEADALRAIARYVIERKK